MSTPGWWYITGPIYWNTKLLTKNLPSLLLEVINGQPRLSWSEDYKVLWNRAGRRKELVQKLSVWEKKLPVELTFSYTDPWGGEVEDKWVLDNDEYYYRTPWQMTIHLFDKYKDVL